MTNDAATGGYQVLIVDDSRISRRLLSGLLEKSRIPGLEILEAANAQNALQTLAASQVDAMFVDINMPGPSGIDFVAAVRGKGIKMPIVVMSSTVTESAREASKKAGANAFLPKPFQLDAVRGLLGNELGMAWLTKKSPVFGDPELIVGWLKKGMLRLNENYPSLNLRAGEREKFSTSADVEIGAYLSMEHQKDERRIAIFLNSQSVKTFCCRFLGADSPEDMTPEDIHDVLSETLNISMSEVTKSSEKLLEDLDVEDRHINMSVPKILFGQDRKNFLKNTSQLVSSRVEGFGFTIVIVFIVD